MVSAVSALVYFGPAIIYQLQADLPGDDLLGVHLRGQYKRMVPFLLDQNIARKSRNKVNLFSNIIFTESAHWADLVIESRCPCVCPSPPSEIYFQASHWPTGHM